MFNFCREQCGCNRHCQDHCRPKRQCCKHDFKEGCRHHGCRPPKPVCHPVCFNVTVKQCEKCREFNGCNSYPETYHDKCKDSFKMICFCCD